MLRKEVLEEIQDVGSAENWDLCKIYVQSIIRAFRKPKASESKIAKMNKDITKLNEEIAADSSRENLAESIEELNTQIQNELSKLSESWLTRSKAHWIEHRERSTKYFFAKYKARKTQTAQNSQKPIY